MSRLSSINDEISKCQNMLRSIGGGAHLGAEASRLYATSSKHDAHGMTAYQSKHHATSILSISHMKDCNGQPISRHVGDSYVHNGKVFKEIVYRSLKKGVIEISAICVFQQFTVGEGDKDDTRVENEWYPLAYLFTTNDPLNMDNFNYFTDAGRPEYTKCVEQLAFCEHKVKIGLKCIENTSDDDFKAAIKSMVAGADPDRFPPPLSVIFPKIIDKQLMIDAENVMSGAAMKNASLSELRPKLAQEANLPQFKFYKQAGRSVPDVGGFLNTWNKFSFLCVLSARMRQLIHSANTQQLVAGMVFRCVAEVRDDDKIWAFKLTGKGEKLDLFCDLANKKRLHEEVIATLKTEQDLFIGTLGLAIERGDANDAFALLTGDTPHKLGLSERLVQSIWTKQIVFPELLKSRITAELAVYGIELCFDVPELEECRLSSFEIANAIGVAKSA